MKDGYPKMFRSFLTRMVSAPTWSRSAWVVLALALADGGDLRADPLRRLEGKAYRDAVDARNRADQLRASVEQQIAADRKNAGDPKKADPKKAREAAADVIRAYQDVIARYPHTEVAA